MTDDPKALIAEARFGGHTAQEVAGLLDTLASAADRCDANSYSEIASISRRGSAAIRRLADALEEATPPEGWRVTQLCNHDASKMTVEYGKHGWLAYDPGCASPRREMFRTARAAMEALGEIGVSSNNGKDLGQK